MPTDRPRITPNAGRSSRTATEIRTATRRRRELLVGHEDLIAAIEQLLFRDDPVGINFGTNKDEYRPEAESIALRLVTDGTSSQSTLREMILDEFALWFGALADCDAATYDCIAEELWTFWRDAGK
jgi:hypothetical protein